MDSQTHHTSTPSASDSPRRDGSASADFSVRTHLEQAWELLKKNLYPLFALNAITYLGVIFIFILSVVLFFVFVFSQPQVNAMLKDASSMTPEAVLSIFRAGVVPFLILIVGVILLSSAGTAAVLLVFGRPEEKKGIFPLFIDGLKLFPMMFIYGIISGIIICGGMFLFLIPGIIMSIFMAFGLYEVIIHKRSPFAAIARSVQIVHTHFGLIFVRSLLLWLFAMVIGALLSGMLANKEMAGYYVIFQFIFGMFYGWYSIAYAMTLYNYVDAQTPHDDAHSPSWIYILAVIGWVLAILVGYLFVGKLAPMMAESMKKAQSVSQSKKAKTTFTNWVPSNCGLSVPLPNTVDLKGGQGRHWIYEERPLAEDNFYGLVPQSVSSQGVLGAYLAYKKDSQRYQPEDKVFTTSYTGLNIYCVNNPNAISLSQFVEQAKKSTKYTLVVDAKTQKWGDVETQTVNIEGINPQGDFFKEPLYLGSTPDSKRLFFIRVRGVQANDSMSKELGDDINDILMSLKYRTVTEPVSAGSQATSGGNQPAGPSCTPYKIYEGEFASDKCYSTQDYNDLQYYLRQYNHQISLYNGAIASMRITCNGSDFFKSSCERSTKQKSDSEGKINEYKATIHGIIAKGK